MFATSERAFALNRLTRHAYRADLLDARQISRTGLRAHLGKIRGEGENGGKREDRRRGGKKERE